MIRDAVMESIAVSVLVAAATLPVTCVSLPKVEPNLQPIVAVGGTYAMMEAPDEEPEESKCSTCGVPVPPGGGWLGDGTVKVPCPECNESSSASDCEKCGCDGIYEKDGKRYICPCKNCEDGKCTTR